MQNKKKIFQDFLHQVEHPMQYLGLEENAVRKSDEGIEIKFASVFPDTYTVGMSHTGSAILYSMLNAEADIVCERAYLPNPDFMKVLKDNDFPLYSLESRKPLSKFDFIGFSLNTELNYTNILHILDLANIPLKSTDRDESFPLIIAGGTVALHSAPLNDFIDAFLLGDAEANLISILRMYKELKKSGLSRVEILRKVSAKYESFYVPAFYEFSYENDRLVSIKPKFEEIGDRKADFIEDFDKAHYPLKPLVPVVESIHSRAVLEIMRGCTQGCRFCQAGIAYRPQRYKSVETLLDQADTILANTGYEELSLLSLSSSDYPHLKELTSALNQKYAMKNISIALPSLRVDDQLHEIIERTGLVRDTGLTIAPEAATERLRKVINKNITDQDLIEGCRNAFSKGYARLKLYFMLGLPTETDEDALAIGKLLKQLLEVAKSANPKRRPKMRVTLSPFVPKPHTPFQWHAQAPIELIKHRINLVTTELYDVKHAISVNWHYPYSSALETAMSRGDTRLSKVIEIAYRNGAILDNWDSHFNYHIWDEAFEEAGMSMYELAEMSFDFDDVLPWQHLQTGLSEEYLKKEYKKALDGESTFNCHPGNCNSCGFNVQFCISKTARPDFSH